MYFWLLFLELGVIKKHQVLVDCFTSKRERKHKDSKKEKEKDREKEDRKKTSNKTKTRRSKGDDANDGLT